jgi:hypothetical protein
MRVRRIVVPLLALASLSFFSVCTAGAAGVPVACGDTIAGAGILTGDLDCSTSGGSIQPPVLRNSTCETSVVASGTAPTWGVCSQD